MDEHKHSLIPSSSGGLVPSLPLAGGVLSSLVTQTLSLAKPEKPSSDGVSILFADWDDELVDVFEEAFRACCLAEPVEIVRCGEVPILMDASSRGRFDIAIVTLNNVFGVGPAVNERVKVMLNVITFLKETHRIPIVALSGYYDADDLPERAVAAGASVFRDRTDTEDLAALVQMYLSRTRPEIPWVTT